MEIGSTVQGIEVAASGQRVSAAETRTRGLAVIGQRLRNEREQRRAAGLAARGYSAIEREALAAAAERRQA